MSTVKKIAFIFLSVFILIGSSFAYEPADFVPAYQTQKTNNIFLDLDPAHYPAVYSEYTATDEEKKDNKAFLIRVNCKENTITIYKKGNSGEYDAPIMSMICSVGKNTPRGTYTTSTKYKWHELFGRSYGQYCTRIVGNILFHSVPYTAMSNSALKYEEYNKLGTSASMGCVRLQAVNAQWIYENCASGTKTVLYDDDDPGPLGKPEYVPIDTEDTFRGWDPTDTDINNPWRDSPVYAPIRPESMPDIVGIEN